MWTGLCGFAAELYASFGDVGITGNQSDDWDSDLCDPDAQLNLVERLEKYVDAEHVYSRYEHYYHHVFCDDHAI